MMNPPRRFFVFTAIVFCALQMLRETSSKDCGRPLLDEPVEVVVVEGESLLLNITLHRHIFESETYILWTNKTWDILATKLCSESSNSIVLKCGIDGYKSLHYAIIDIQAVDADASIQILEILISSSEYDGTGIYKLEKSHMHELGGTHGCPLLDVNLTVLRVGPMPTSRSYKTVQISFNATSMASIKTKQSKHKQEEGSQPERESQGNSYFQKLPSNTQNMTFNVLVMVTLVISILTSVQLCGVRLYRAIKSRKRVKRCPGNQFDP